ncbi:aldo/keto reductase [Frankia sp. CNm7]|uniref:Aldo/keto reductase n=1 Tax=Frankia nepalensis TaxID=1836974 RepID=A0A937USE7_9ACTN|nr:aldo/keto reductase [Frankia nepalensis]MBL7499054.1 aldo/keto reductase [Frankia nepalensis]MBL7514506.1 aldo/keto reductase [Frankia nepalensis]MBL7520538.1 aldo/keto reductase [Frankia nepalensis]MBL7632038.1 aldo/keto reductase [Frankia nepalensis]
MKYRKFGRTGVEVSSQCLGAMMFGVIGNPDHDECERMIGRALDAGINFIDTADIYSRGESEQIVGQAVKTRRDDVIIATKCFNPMGADRNQRGGSRRWIMKAAEDSLRRLGTDYIDLYQVHRHDWDTDLEETLGALTDLVHQGKVRYLGSSTFPADWIVEAQWAAQRRNSERFVSEQPQYSIFARSVEQAVLPACLRHGIGVIPWSPLSGGWLTGKYQRGQAEPASSRYAAGSVFAQGRTISGNPDSEVRFDAVEELSKIAAAAGLSLTHLALAFVDRHPAVSSTIIGPKTLEQLDDVLAAVDVVLDDATLDAIDKVVRPGTDIAGVFHMTGDPSLRPELRRRLVTQA